MTQMKTALQKAGVDPVEAEFRAALAKYLGAGGTRERAIQICEAVGQHERAVKAAPPVPTVSQNPSEGEGQGDDAAKASPRLLTPSPPNSRGAGQYTVAESATRQVSTLREPSASAKAAAKKVAQMSANSIWDRTIGGEVKMRGSTRHHWDTLTRKGIVMTHVGQRMLTEVNWPDDVTPLEKCATEAQVKAILDSGYGALNRIAMR